MLLLKQFWDGLIDPFIGIMTDNLTSKYGRRKPFVLIFIWPAIIFWVLMWTSPTWVFNIELSQPTKILYFTGVLFIFSFFDSLVFIPYQAMIPDISDGYHSRTFVVLFTQIFHLSGTGLSSFVWTYLIKIFRDTDGSVNFNRGYFFAAVFMSFPILFVYLFSILIVKERKVDLNARLKPQREQSLLYDSYSVDDFKLSKFRRFKAKFEIFKTALKEILLFPPFLAIVGFSIVNLVGVALFTNNIILWLKYVYKDQQITPYALIILQVPLSSPPFPLSSLSPPFPSFFSPFSLCSHYSSGSSFFRPPSPFSLPFVSCFSL